MPQDTINSLEELFEIISQDPTVKRWEEILNERKDQQAKNALLFGGKYMDAEEFLEKKKPHGRVEMLEI